MKSTKLKTGPQQNFDLTEDDACIVHDHYVQHDFNNGVSLTQQLGAGQGYLGLAPQSCLARSRVADIGCPCNLFGGGVK